MVCTAATALNPVILTVASSKSQAHQILNSFLINLHKKHVSVTCSAKFSMMNHFNEPTKLITFLNYTRGKLSKFIHGSVKQFPWKKAESVAQHELLVLGKEILKWSLLGCFAFSCVSDIVYSIFRNRELVIPLGLFAGVLVNKLFDEISLALLNDRRDGYITQLLVISCFYVLLKAISTYVVRVNDFLFHVANGGLLQAPWSRKEFLKLDGDKSSWNDASTSLEVDR